MTYTIRDREIKQLKQINGNLYVFVKVYHYNGKYCASVNREIHEQRDGYVSTMTQPFDALPVGIDAGRYSDKRLTQYADAILPNMDAIVDAFLALPDRCDIAQYKAACQAIAQKYFWNPTAGLAK